MVGGGGGVGRGGGGGGTVDVNQELKLFENWKKSGVVGSGGCEPRIEVIVKMKQSG